MIIAIHWGHRKDEHPEVSDRSRLPEDLQGMEAEARERIALAALPGICRLCGLETKTSRVTGECVDCSLWRILRKRFEGQLEHRGITGWRDHA